MLVMGVGNTLLSDEGAGVHAMRRAEQAYPDADTEFVDAGTLSFTLAGLLEHTGGLVVIDAARMDSEPGTVRVFEGEAMDRYLAGHRKMSVHEVSLSDLLQIARLTGELPQARALVGIEPLVVDWGEEPSPPVARALDEAARAVGDLIGRWRPLAGASA